MALVTDVVIVAAGRGARLGHGRPKAAVELAGRPLFVHALRGFARLSFVRRMVLVAPPEPAEQEEIALALARYLEGTPPRIVPGGAERQDSVRAGLQALAEAGTAEADLVLIHDAARPVVLADLVLRCLEELARTGDGAPVGCIPGLPVRDTLKQVEDGEVVGTRSREGLFAAQTPQAFRFGPLRRAHAAAFESGFTATDDAALLEREGHRVRVVPGDHRNLKVTYPDDLLHAERILAELREEDVKEES